MGVKPQKYLDDLSICKWLATLDEKLATQEAINEACSYIKNAAEYWISPWKVKGRNFLK